MRPATTPTPSGCASNSWQRSRRTNAYLGINTTGRDQTLNFQDPKVQNRTILARSGEMQVLTGMSQGKSNAQIGRELYLSEDTIKTHARRLFRKLGAKDRAEAVATGFRRGIMT